MTRILVLGAGGTLGHTMMRVLSESRQLDVWGTVRSGAVKRHFSPDIADRICAGVDVENADSLVKLFGEIRPDLVINCIGLVKQLAAAGDPLVALPINAMLPHRLANLCALNNARLIHFSTDCVFSGKRGNYVESDLMDAIDLYGQSKFIGELSQPHTLTLRTSIIGHELETSQALIEWFLKQDGAIKGYRQAIFSGLPTVVISRLVRDVILRRADLSGVYHVAAEPISKFDLLSLVAKIYGKSIEIIPDDSVRINRSLDGSRFRQQTGFTAPSWPLMIEAMNDYR